MKKNWIRGIVGGLSFTSALFIFQACYGTPQDFGDDLYIEGQVKSKSTGQPIEGIKVAVKDTPQNLFTNEQGLFSFYTPKRDSLTLLFSDLDADLNGSYTDRDTLLTNVDDYLYLDIALEEK